MRKTVIWIAGIALVISGGAWLHEHSWGAAAAFATALGFFAAAFVREKKRPPAPPATTVTASQDKSDGVQTVAGGDIVIGEQAGGNIKKKS